MPGNAGCFGSAIPDDTTLQVPLLQDIASAMPGSANKHPAHIMFTLLQH